MGLRPRFSRRALDDLKHIRSYLSQRSPKGADHVRAAITATIDLIAEFPRSGRSTDLPGIRVLPVVRYPYFIYYTLTADALHILHVRHAARDRPKADDL